MKRLQAFVIMPFDPEFDAVYKDLIARPLENAGYDVTRADDVDARQNVLADVVRGISHADLIVADMTTGNANVFYELGLAHAMGVPTVLIAEQSAAEEIPFDLRQYRTEFYETHFQRADGIKRALSRLATAHATGKATFGSPVSDFLAGAERPVIRARRSGASGGQSPSVAGHQTRHSRRSTDDTTGGPQESLGMLDFVEALEDAAAGFGSILGEVNAATERIGSEISGLTGDMNALDPASPTTQARGKKLLLRTATLLDGYADNLSKHEAAYDQRVDEITANGLGYLTLLAEKPDQFRDDLESARATSLELRTSVVDASRGMLELRNAVADLPPMIKQIVRARDRSVHALDVFVAQQERVRSYAEQAISLTAAALATDAGDSNGAGSTARVEG